MLTRTFIASHFSCRYCNDSTERPVQASTSGWGRWCRGCQRGATINMAKKYVLKTAAGGLNINVGDALGGGLWKWVDGEPKVFEIISPIRKGSVIARSGITTAPDICDVRDIETGTDRRILVGKVLLSTLTENYPNDSYVGRSFRCTQNPPPPGKRYKSMTVEPVEVEDPAEETEAKPAEPKRKK